MYFDGFTFTWYERRTQLYHVDGYYFENIIYRYNQLAATAVGCPKKETVLFHKKKNIYTKIENGF